MKKYGRSTVSEFLGGFCRLPQSGSHFDSQACLLSQKSGSELVFLPGEYRAKPARNMPA